MELIDDMDGSASFVISLAPTIDVLMDDVAVYEW